MKGDDPMTPSGEREHLRRVWRERQARRGEPIGWRKFGSIARNHETMQITRELQDLDAKKAKNGPKQAKKESFRGGWPSNVARLPSILNTRPIFGRKHPCRVTLDG